jgi:hypothetical protein
VHLGIQKWSTLCCLRMQKRFIGKGKQQMSSRICIDSAQRVSPYEAWPLRFSGTISGSCRDIELESEHVSTFSFPLFRPSRGRSNPSSLKFQNMARQLIGAHGRQPASLRFCGCLNRGVDSDRPCRHVHVAVSRLYTSQMGTSGSRMGTQTKALGVAALIFFTKVKGDRQDRRTARG